MKTSVIIPTYNGAHKIFHVLEGLKKQSIKPDEIIVVIDGSTDNTEAVAEGFKTQLPQLRTVLQSNRGRAEVRNRGADEAEGPLLLFLDDDILPGVDWIAAHIKHHQLHAESILTSSATEPSSMAHTDFQKFKVHLSKRWIKDLVLLNKKQFSKKNVFITAANFSIPKAVFNRIGGFDKILNDGEDFDFAVRATNLDVPVFFDADAFAWHLEKITCVHLIKRIRSYEQAGVILLQTKPEIYGSFFSGRSDKAKTVKSQIFRLFCFKFWIRSIDKEWWVWMPKAIRFKLYDLVLTANAIYFPNSVKI